jgi:hypothetical protein
MGVAVAIGFDALEPGGAGLVLGTARAVRFAYRGFIAAGDMMSESRDPAESRADQGLNARQGSRHKQFSLWWSAPGKLAARKCESYLVF